MNEFVSWCRHLLVSFLFHALTSLHPPSFHRNDFSTCSTYNKHANCRRHDMLHEQEESQDFSPHTQIARESLTAFTCDRFSHMPYLICNNCPSIHSHCVKSNNNSSPRGQRVVIHEKVHILLHPLFTITRELFLNFAPSPRRDTQIVPQPISICRIPHSSLDIVSGEYHI